VSVTSRHDRTKSHVLRRALKQCILILDDDVPVFQCRRKVVPCRRVKAAPEEAQSTWASDDHLTLICEICVRYISISLSRWQLAQWCGHPPRTAQPQSIHLFELLTGTPITPAVDNVHTDFGFPVPFCFWMRIMYETDGSILRRIVMADNSIKQL